MYLLIKKNSIRIISFVFLILFIIGIPLSTSAKKNNSNMLSIPQPTLSKDNVQNTKDLSRHSVDKISWLIDSVRKQISLGKKKLNKESMMIHNGRKKLIISDNFKCINKSPMLGIKANDKITIEFYETSLREALAELSSASGARIFPDNSVSGTISATFKNAPFKIILENMLASSNYTYKVFPNYILVGSGNKENPGFSMLAETCVFMPAHRMAKDLLQSIPIYYRSFIIHNELTDALTIQATTNNMQKIREMLSSLDKPKLQVLLEVSVMEVDQKKIKDIGINWNKLKHLYIALEAGVTEIMDMAFATPIFMGGVVNYATLPTGSLWQAVHFLQANGLVLVKTIPSVITLDGKEAKISSTEKRWLNARIGLGTTTFTNTTTIDYGVELQIKPHILNEEQLRLSINSAKVSDLVSDEYGQPRVISHQISNEVRVNNADTLILGGLLQKKVDNQRTILPWFGNLPIVGSLFGEKRGSFTSTEVLVLIRAKIIKNHLTVESPLYQAPKPKNVFYEFTAPPKEEEDEEEEEDIKEIIPEKTAEEKAAEEKAAKAKKDAQEKAAKAKKDAQEKAAKAKKDAQEKIKQWQERGTIRKVWDYIKGTPPPKPYPESSSNKTNSHTNSVIPVEIKQYL